MYITQSNLNKLIDKVQVNPQDLLELPDIRLFISDHELEWLSKAYKFFSCHDKITLTYLQKVETYSDTYTMLYESVYPAYHFNKNCQLLQNSYNNLYIPAEIQARGHQEVEKFRNYIKKFSFDDLTKEDVFLAIKAQFSFTDPTFTTLSRKNSGIKKIDFNALSISEIKNILQESIQTLENFAHQSDEHKKIFNLRYRQPKDILRLTKNHASASIGKELSDLKNQLLLSQKAIFRQSTNFNEESINENILKEHGFVACSVCFRKHQYW